jgi:hypothetical protein
VSGFLTLGKVKLRDETETLVSMPQQGWVVPELQFQ